MHLLRNKGFSLSINDFDDAANIIDTIKDLPIDEIKVGFGVISNIGVQESAQETFRKVMCLSQQHGLRVVAVGIEHKKQAEWLHNQGCDRGQGYFCGQTFPGDKLNNFILDKSSKKIFVVERRLKLLILEDDEQYRELLAESLSDLYDVVTAAIINEARDLFLKEKPELVIFDVNLPDGSGIELCKEFKASVGNHEYSSVFISGSEDPIHKLEAYEVGAIDYIKKPCPFPELVAKMGRVSTFHIKQQDLKGNSDKAQAAVLESLKEASDYGVIVHFFKNLLACRDEPEMSARLFSFMKDKGLLCSVQFRSRDAIVCFNS
jgi:CheY-like chemotaxis protein